MIASVKNYGPYGVVVRLAEKASKYSNVLLPPLMTEPILNPPTEMEVAVRD